MDPTATAMKAMPPKRCGFLMFPPSRSLRDLVPSFGQELDGIAQIDRAHRDSTMRRSAEEGLSDRRQFASSIQSPIEPVPDVRYGNVADILRGAAENHAAAAIGMDV